MDVQPTLLSKEDLELHNPILTPEIPKMKAKLGPKVKKVKMPKPKMHKSEKKVRTHKIKTIKAPVEGGKMKIKHQAHAHAHHPPWADMMCAAVKSLNEKHGSSIPAIKKYILANYTIDIEPSKITPMMKRGAKAALASKMLRQVKGKGLSGSFKLPLHPLKTKKVGKKMNKTKGNGKLIKKKTGGKTIVKKEKKIKKTGMKVKGKKIKGKKSITLNLSQPLLDTGKIKMTKKPITGSKKVIKKVKKAPMKGNKSAKVRMTLVPKKAVITPPNLAMTNIGTAGMPILVT